MRAGRSIIGGVFLVIALAGATFPASAQCDAPASWFPHTDTQRPDNSDPGKENCKFHQWSWQTFLWLTQKADGDLRFITQMHSADDLFAPSKSGLAALDLSIPAWKNRPKERLRLHPRDVKPRSARPVHLINQPGDNGILVDQEGHPVFFAIHVNQDYYDFIQSNGYNDPRKLMNAPATQNFRVGTLEVKSSWRIINPGEKKSAFYWTTAEIARLKTVNGHVEIDPNHFDEKQVALVGLHVAGVVVGHPEFVWATFELKGNAPTLPPGMPMNSRDPVSNFGARFYTAKTRAFECNRSNAGKVTLNEAEQTLTPITQVFRLFAGDGGTDAALIQKLNQSVQGQLGGDVAANYDLIGSLWVQDGVLQPNIIPGTVAPSTQQGSINLANTTMETFGQFENCFTCHNTQGYKDNGTDFPPMNLNLSHALRQTAISNNDLLLKAQKAPKAPTK
jgi:hypothetical protein